MRRRYARLIVAALLVVGGIAVASASSQAAPAVRQQSQLPAAGAVSRIVNPGSSSAIKFWTKARLKKARPRDYVVNPASRRFRPAPSRRFTFSPTGTIGASWNAGGPVNKTTGKVFFAMGAQYWVCSGSVVLDGAATDRSIVVTAAHCAYDETNNVWATNWMFVPDYDSSPAALTASGSFCENTTYGCWTARSLVVPRVFASQISFNATAARHDYAFAVLGTGGKKSTHLDAEVGGQAIGYTTREFESTTHLFGYPSQGRYKGGDLMYCSGWLGYDVATDYETYRLPCRLTAGTSGGPWFSPFEESGSSVGTGTIFSVTSYGYAGIKALYGPFFGTETSQMFTVATSIGSGNVLHPAS